MCTLFSAFSEDWLCTRPFTSPHDPKIVSILSTMRSLISARHIDIRYSRFLAQEYYCRSNMVSSQIKIYWRRTNQHQVSDRAFTGDDNGPFLRNRVQITCNTSSAYHVRVSCYFATWYEGTAQLLRLTELKSYLFELYFVGWIIKPFRGR